MSKRADGSYSSAWRGLTKIVVPPLLAAFTKHEWHGQDYIRNVSSSSGVILAANHLSYADPLPLCLFTHRAGRYPVFLAKSSLFEIKGLGVVMRGTGQLPVYRDQADAALVLRDVEQGLRDGACVIFYPEGTATRDPDLWPMVPRTGVARAALTTGVPVIPVAQWGAQRISALRQRPPAPAAAHHRADHRGPAGRPVRVPGQAAEHAGTPRGHRTDHEGHHRPAGRHPRRDSPGGAVPSGDRPPQGATGSARGRTW